MSWINASAATVCALSSIALNSSLLARPLTLRVSLTTLAGEANCYSAQPSISGDGRFTAFASCANNLVPHDTNGGSDVFVHDRRTGYTFRVSVASSGLQANGGSALPTITPDARFVLFESTATNLASSATAGVGDAFLHDRASGVSTHVSVDNAGLGGIYNSQPNDLSADGRFVLFTTRSALVPEDTNELGDAYVRDTVLGITERVSVSSSGTQATQIGSGGYAISADGRFVVFGSGGADLVPDDTNNAWDIFVHDRVTRETTRASVSSSGSEANAQCVYADISGDGRWVTFSSDATNLVAGDLNGTDDVFVRDRLSGQTSLVSVSPSGNAGNAGSAGGTLSYDGRHIAFSSRASDLVSGDTNGVEDVFLRELVLGRTTRVSVSTEGAQAMVAHNGFMAISSDGRFVAFTHVASNLVPGDTNGWGDVFRSGACPPDLSSDGVVGFADLNLVLAHYGATGPPGAVQGDVNGDGLVSFVDLNLVLSSFGFAC